MKSGQSAVSRFADITLLFIKMGFMTFGGGYAMIPLIEQEVVDRKGWVGKEDLLETLAVAQSLPGSLSINTSILIGHAIGGIPGAVSAVVGAALPPFLTLTAIAAFFSGIRGNPLVEGAFMGVRCAVVALIWHAGMGTAKEVVTGWSSVAMLAITIVLMLFTTLNPALLIVGAALLGIGSVYLKTLKKSRQTLDHENEGSK